MMRRGRGSVGLGETAGILILLVGAASMVLPFLWMVATSLKTYNEAFQVPPTFIPQVAQWNNYAEVLTAVPFGRFYFNSIATSTAITLGQLVTCSMGAYAFARLNFKGRDKIFVVYLATLMVPAQVTMIPTFIIVKWLGWIDSYKALILPSIFSAYGTFLLRQFYLSIPMELEEAVRIDGGGAYRCFFQIILPLTKPALATLGTFVFLFFWNSFLWPLLVTNTTDMFTLPMGIQLFVGRFTAQWHLMMAAATMAMLPMIVVYLFAQKYFVEGIAMTGLKA